MSVNVFIGSSTESLPVAQSVQTELRKRNSKYFPIIWNQSVVKSSKYVIPELIKELNKSQYAIFIFNDDDFKKSRGKTTKVVRDNVLFEFGLAVGILGNENCFVFKTKDSKVPSDFDGLTYSIYNKENFEQNPCAEIGQAITEFEYSIKENDYNEIFNNIIDWNDYCFNVNSICQKISKSPRLSGFRFDIVVGISRGGIIAADLINRKFLTKVPMACLWGDYYENQPDILFETKNTEINSYLFEALKSDKYKNILVVDDITRTGNTLISATNLLRSKFKDKIIKSAVLYVPEKYKNKVDYYGEIVENLEIAMPYSILD